MNRRFTLTLCLGVVCSVATASDARAQYGLGCGGYGAFDIGRLYQVLSQNVPYYAAFPPVYYSAPVPRTYGHSPFAYPPGTMTPEIVDAAPLEINNPHFDVEPGPSIAPAASDKTTQLNDRSIPLAIVNPYVVGQDVEDRLTSLSVSTLAK